MSGDSTDTADTIRERGNVSSARLLLTMRLDRTVLTGLLAVAVFLGFLLTVTTLAPEFLVKIKQGALIDTLFSSMIIVIVTGTTLVVSIGQLVISQEDGPLGEQRSRMSDTLDFRNYTSEVIGKTTPVDPAAFLLEIIRASAERAATLRATVADSDDGDLRSEVEAFTDGVVDNADEVSDQLEGATFGTFDVLFAALNFNYSRKLFQTERLGDEYGDELEQSARDELDALQTTLAMFGPAREHIKTLYFQWELIAFSQLTLYASVPALIVAGGMLAAVDATTFPGELFGVDTIALVVGAAFAVTLLPFLLFVSYLLRILTVAKWTLAIGPLVLRESQR